MADRAAVEDSVAPEQPETENHNEEEDEAECRVCRCPAEEGRPLFKPCICSGTIGLTHQDCLQSWLQVQRGRSSDGKCELCHVAFRFAPQYDASAPVRLSSWTVVVGVFQRAATRWLPIMLRCSVALALWLVVAPVATAFLYHAWMARASPTVLWERCLTWKLFVTDLVSGAVVIAGILISFLSMMSFADFLRVEWQQRGGLVGGGRRGRQRQQQQEDGQNDNNTRGNVRFTDEGIDNGLWDYAQQQVMQRQTAAHYVALDRELHEIREARPFDDPDNDDADEDSIRRDGDDDESWNEEDDAAFSSDDEEDWLPDDDDVDLAEINNVLPEDQDQPQEGQIQRDDARMDQPPPFDMENEDAMDINIALDELLGFRGPLVVVGRNLLWLLAFNAVYLGFFAFVPRTVGMAFSSLFFNTTIAYSNTTAEVVPFNVSQNFSMLNLWNAIEAESAKENTAFRLHDVASVTLGYLSLAWAAVAFRFLWLLSQKMRLLNARDGVPIRDRNIHEVREALDEMNRLVQGLGHDVPPLGDDPPAVAISIALGIAVDAMLAIVKVGVLLFLKMFMLPILLGILLDASTVSLFGSTLDDRIAYAGSDLFSFIMLHWVAGITFMLLVTVSVLQLREVAHPDLLAQMIRPQEPQPDLLGNLMHENVSTHTRRMLLSLVIYAFLLGVHVLIPVRFAVSTFVGKHVPFLRLKFSYLFTPQLQVPLELLFFHLSMLALLEKYKNVLGGIQHYWLKFTTNLMGISDRVLPQEVRSFRLLGSRAAFLQGRDVDPFWCDLAKEDKKGALRMISANLDTFELAAGTALSSGETKPDGERVLGFGSDFIRLPVRLPGRALRSRSILLCTSIAKYRLKLYIVDDKPPLIQLWEEVNGRSIPRPPEGWDDLGAGGADVQGRWAWGKEKKSSIEVGVAARRPFFEKNQGFVESISVYLKLVVLAAISWMASTVLLCVVLLTPLFVGRTLYFVLQVPEQWTHDPFGFALGFYFVFPLVRNLVGTIFESDVSLRRRVVAWWSRFHPPPLYKTLVLLNTAVLWFGVAPLLTGFLYELTFIKQTDWFMGSEPWITKRSTALSWAVGAVLLYMWSDLCIRGILTGRYRALVVGGPEVAEADHPGNAEAAAWLDAGGGRLRLTWQGEHGRMARFVDTWKSVILDWEWDKVDEVTLLKDCAAPVVIELFWTLLFPVASMMVIFWKFPIMSGLARAIFVRTLLGLSCCVQIGRVWKDQLSSWFEAAHKTVRDDRYLIGEILMNHGE